MHEGVSFDEIDFSLAHPKAALTVVHNSPEEDLPSWPSFVFNLLIVET